jgi:four helix bundle protein
MRNTAEQDKRMGELKTHKDLDVWKEAMLLAKEVYLLTARFPKEEAYGLVLQMRRAAVSVPSNIAEGAARNSAKEFIQFLHISLGSLAELETQVFLSMELGYDIPAPILEQIERVRKMLLGLIKRLRRKAGQSCGVTHYSLLITHHA